MTNIQKILEVIELQFRGAPFRCNQLTKIVGFQAGRFLDHLVRLGILIKEKQETRNVYRIGPEWEKRNNLVMQTPRLGYLADRVWQAILHQEGKEFSISDIESFLKREGFEKSKIRDCLKNLVKAKAIEAVGWWEQERTYLQIAKERPKL